MTESSKPWDSNDVGDAVLAPYDAVGEFAEIFRLLSTAEAIPTDLSGVFRGVLNELVVTSGASQATVGSGCACAYGTLYRNTANVNVTVDAATTTRVDVIVLDRNINTKTVRITKITGADGAGVPAVTNTGTNYYTILANASVDAAGTVTITDRRVFLPGFSNHISTGSLALTASYASLTSIVLPAGIFNVTADIMVTALGVDNDVNLLGNSGLYGAGYSVTDNTTPVVSDIYGASFGAFFGVPVSDTRHIRVFGSVTGPLTLDISAKSATAGNVTGFMQAMRN